MRTLEQTLLLAEFGRLLGVELQWDSQQTCLLMVDDVPVRFRATDDEIALRCPLGTLPMHAGGAWWRRLLSVNRQCVEAHGVALAFDPVIDEAILVRTVRTAGMIAAELAAEVTRMLDQRPVLLALWDVAPAGPLPSAVRQPIAPQTGATMTPPDFA